MSIVWQGAGRPAGALGRFRTATPLCLSAQTHAQAHFWQKRMSRPSMATCGALMCTAQICRGQRGQAAGEESHSAVWREWAAQVHSQTCWLPKQLPCTHALYCGWGGHAHDASAMEGVAHIKFSLSGQRRSRGGGAGAACALALRRAPACGTCMASRVCTSPCGAQSPTLPAL